LTQKAVVQQSFCLFLEAASPMPSLPRCSGLQLTKEGDHSIKSSSGLHYFVPHFCWGCNRVIAFGENLTLICLFDLWSSAKDTGDAVKHVLKPGCWSLTGSF
jgi:hypothetical protein